MVELEEFEPGRWRVKRPELPRQRSDLPLPYVISDIMEPTEQVDGRFYTSKSEFRRVGRSHGLIEIGTEKLPTNKPRASRLAGDARRKAIKTAIEKYQAGHRPGR